MATFIFLHGSFHAAWNWHRVLPLLEAAGHHGIALDLPGHGRDRTAVHRVTLDRSVQAVVDCLERLTEPAVLVAHSRNGIVISEVAERCPERVLGLVYLAAYLVPDGRSMMDYAITDRESLVLQNVELGLDRRLLPQLIRLLRPRWVRLLLAQLLPRARQVHRLKPSAYHAALYHDCDEEILALAQVLLEAEPNWAGFSPLRLSAARYGRVPRVYIECLQDRAVTLPLQRRMQAETVCDKTYSLDSGHSPFFSQPDRLREVLVDSLSLFAARAAA